MPPSGLNTKASAKVTANSCIVNKKINKNNHLTIIVSHPWSQETNVLITDGNFMRTQFRLGGRQFAKPEYCGHNGGDIHGKKALSFYGTTILRHKLSL